MANTSDGAGHEPWRVLEFYSGIGGMRYSLMKAGVNAKVVEAFEINDKANDVYQHNFGHRPFQGNIQSLNAADLDSYRADAWLLSPPCQPYTRQGLQKDTGDARAFSFLQILELMQLILRPPSVLFVENVVGFETSDTHAKMIEMLEKTNFITQEFILSPLQFGIPYSRPRYFCLAKRKTSSFRNGLSNYQLIQSPRPLFDHGDTISYEDDPSQEDWDNLLQSCEPIENFLELKNFGNETNVEPDSLRAGLSEDDLLTLGKDVDHECDVISSDQYVVPLSLIERWGNAMDVVYPDSKRCCCFTKSYYRYVKGTGSLLATIQPKKKGKDSLKEQGLRFFTPREVDRFPFLFLDLNNVEQFVANLHCFPEDFEFPQHISLRQRYALLGNSLSVGVVAPLLRYLFTDPL